VPGTRTSGPAASPTRLDRLTYPRELLANLTLRELRGKYKRSALGWGWSVLNPLAMIVIYTAVFSRFFRTTPPIGDPSGLHSYAFFLVTGLLPWLFLSNGLNGAVSSLTGNEGLIKKVYFPRSILPTASTLAWLATFGVEMAVLGVLLITIGGNMVLPWIPVVIAIAAIQFFFVLGLGLLVSPINAYFRDIEHFVGIVLMAWFWLTPIVYPETLATTNSETGEPNQFLGIDVSWLIDLNPMSHFITAYRDAAYSLRFPALTTWAAMSVAAAGTMLVGYLVFRKLEPNLAEEL
jgi:ABC-2 type transport system permease protein